MMGRIPSIYSGLWALTLLGACALSNPGNDPPPGELNFPLALETSPVPDADGDGVPDSPPAYLYVANSNFDLQYNSGSVAAIDLEVLDATLAGAALPSNANEPPIVVSPPQVIRSQVRMGSYTSGMAISPAGDRLYLSVRADSNLTYIDILDGGRRLSCGGEGDFPACSDAHRTGDEVTANPRRVEVPVDPTGVAVGSTLDLGLAEDGDYVIMSHRSGQASLFVDRAAPAGGAGRPSAPLLVDVLGELPLGQISTKINPEDGIAWIPTTDARRDRADNFLARVGVAVDLTRPEQSYLFDAGPVRLDGINTGEDTRDIAFATIEGTRFAFILSRTPEALVLVDLDQSTPTRLFVRDLVSVGFGPSRMQLVRLPTASGMRLFVFVTCFDSRDVFIVDPLSGRTFTIARTLSGPFELEVDPLRRRMYVTDFRSSVLWIVTLEPLLDCLEGTATEVASCEPFRVASVGEPQPVRDLL